MVHTWNEARARKRIRARLDEVKTVEIVDWTRDLSLENIPRNKAYRVDGVHLYADILNLEEMLNCTQLEGETCHRRTLRFLNLHYRAVDRILNECDLRRVDFANQRLHALVTKPYDDEAMRVHRAVAVAQLVTDALAETGDDDEHIPDAVVRVGIDTSKTLAVNNGRSGNREPLFLGPAANHAAKRAAGGKDAGIFLTNEARAAIGLKQLKASELDATPLTSEEVAASQEKAELGVSKDTIVRQWREDLEKNPIGAFSFSSHTPPMRNLDFTALTPGNSRRQDALSLYADLDGFTAYVGRHIDDEPEDVVRAMHIIRSELEAVLSTEFEGRRIRFIGDCVHGLMAEGTAQTTDAEATISDAVLCAGGLRSSFRLCLELLGEEGVDTAGLGLAVGLEFGPMTATRLGLKGSRTRCSVSRGVLASEAEQSRCSGRQTAIGENAYDKATPAVRNLFGKERIAQHLDYAAAMVVLTTDGDATAREAEAAEKVWAAPAVAATFGQERRPFLRV
ncbi:adenylate/guanylate cyclase domain-containing protein [Roseicella sp. DB1501]|uniref:adenylate/guanylate cyclase domain-containing protein n=1 Tax=Roseicella sp. DB1501 TaxID=2730925 RepID=UPI0014930732|nr:adenylate/guanylate cyclase domain-containing protein [Roseicella sp. DB1501]NOG73613.1 transcriptional regulator [Roseicella sp. DB1501]